MERCYTWREFFLKAGETAVSPLPLMDSGGHTCLGSAEPEGQLELFIAK